MPTVCPFCQANHHEQLSTHGLPFHRCPACNRFFPSASRAQLWPAESLEADSRFQANGTSQVAVADPAVRTPMPLPRAAIPAQDTADDFSPSQTPGPRTHPIVPGYRIERILGRGGMGTVYLARQLSLDRPVALKVMSRRWANDPIFVARFTREAYAAAQLNHPNLVQVYDIGEVESTKFFSMEYVAGRSICDILRNDGKFDPETAVGYILQAARGLKLAHDRGMIHRDIKPDNLLLDIQGLVKVADLGLVKTPDMSHDADKVDSNASSLSGLYTIPADMTGTRMALGTPAYMSPEQCRDAATVDHRADIYSLGCTLYVMVTGRQPFEGDTAVELMTAHAYKPLVPPDEIANRVPKELSSVIQKMMAKHPGERFQTMGEVVRTLEQWLGIHTTTRVSAREDVIAKFEVAVDQFHYSPTNLRRSRILTGFLASCLVSALVLTFVGRLDWAFGLAGMVLQAASVYFVVNGVARRTYLFRRVRQLVLGCSVGDWLVFGGGVVLCVIFLWMLKLFWIWTGFGLIGVALAFALRYGLDRAVEAERNPILDECELILKRMRSEGLNEDQLHLFVAKYAGRFWEELYEELFGYESKLTARTQLLRGECAGQRERFAVWREPIVQLIDSVEQSRQHDRERNLFIQIETKRLLATGMVARAARHHAEQSADEMLQSVNAIRDAELARRMKGMSGDPTGTSGTVEVVRRLIHGSSANVSAEPVDYLGWAIWLVCGPHVRVVFGTICLAGCVTWAVQNHVFTPADGVGAMPLMIAGVPLEATIWIDTATVGWAGILLITSLFYRGPWMSVLVLLGAAVTVFAHKLAAIPSVEPIQDFHVGAMLGTVLSLVGYRFGRR
ncbi:serine/threonine-protein kinase [Limnoglobus roseus]|uniref:Serine/threonine protein kinase n=1 Tax=Limnoglobus roseus TaxID=2598579 RepID=A0A5C1AEY4_9BACT|nr:serine/threonine-protein kinase [Limnoglobus roseus]QEL17989.1 serine/threonine protein kinase [Limnoglobus roseus]